MGLVLAEEPSSCVPSYADGDQQEEIALNRNRIKLDKLAPLFTHGFFYTRVSWVAGGVTFWKMYREVKSDDGERSLQTWMLFCCKLVEYLSSKFQALHVEIL